jgi:hypothetical protein
MRVLSYIIQVFSPGHRYLKVPLAGLLLTASILTGEAKPLLNKELQTPSMSQVVARAEAFGKDIGIAPRGKLPEVDGIYLYSESTEPEQMGQEYMVFEVRQGKVIGAFYLPYSEFNCFHGTLQSGKLALMVANGPDLAPYPESVAGQNSQQVATASDRGHIGNSYKPIAYSYSVALQKYYQLPSVSANDQRILKTCKNNNQN